MMDDRYVFYPTAQKTFSGVYEIKTRNFNFTNVYSVGRIPILSK